VFDYGRSKRDTGSFHFKKELGLRVHAAAYEYKLFKREAIPQTTRPTRRPRHDRRVAGACRAASPTRSALRSCATWGEGAREPLLYLVHGCRFP